MWTAGETQRHIPLTENGRREPRCSSWSWPALHGPVQFFSPADKSSPSKWSDHALQDCNLYLEEIEGEKDMSYGCRRPLRVSGMMKKVCRGAEGSGEYPHQSFRRRRTYFVNNEESGTNV